MIVLRGLWLLSILVSFTFAKDESDEKADADAKKEFSYGLQELKDLDPLTAECKTTIVDDAKIKAVSDAVDKFVIAYPKHPATPMVKAFVFFIRFPKIKELLAALLANVRALKDDKDKERGVQKLTNEAAEYGRIIIDELDYMKGLPATHEKKPEKGEAFEYLKATPELLGELKKEANALIALCKFNETNKVADYNDDKALDVFKATVELVLKVLPLNVECEEFKLLVVRIINRVGISPGLLLMINSKGKVEKFFPKFMDKILHDSAVITCDNIRPLTSTMVFCVSLGLIIVITIVLGIVTVVFSKKADISKKSH